MKNPIDYLPKKTKIMIEEIEVIVNGNYDEETKRFTNLYKVTLRDGYKNSESNDNTCEFTNINYMKFWLNEYVDKINT